MSHSENRTFSCYDAVNGHCTDTLEIQAATAADAARAYAEGGDWGPTETTIWVHVHVYPALATYHDATRIRVALEPDEPACTPGHKHVWEETHCQGHGGGVISTDQCSRCGTTRTTDTWAHDPSDGEQGLMSVTYAEGSRLELELPDGWSVYHSSELETEVWERLTSGHQCVFPDEAGWFFSPDDYTGDALFSSLYATAEEAADACDAWVDRAESEGA